MEPSVRVVVEAVHSSPVQAVLFLAGGASQALGWLMSVPGASNTILEVVVPYSRTSMVQLLGKVPLQFSSEKTAEDMALVAYNRALKLSTSGAQVCGVGFAGSLASTRPKRGEHRFHLSTRAHNYLKTTSITLLKGSRSREGEDNISSHMLLKAVADACKVSATLSSELHASELPEECEILYDEDEELQQVIDGQICMKIYRFSCDTSAESPERKIILSGSFNPLHDGHLKLLEVASSLADGAQPFFEISAVNADKPPLTVGEIKRRVEQFKNAGKDVIISNQPYFYKKAELFPGSAFVIGADTAARLIDPKYYGGSFSAMLEVLVACKRTGVTFFIGGRNVDGVFKVLEDFSIPEQLKDMFISVPKNLFRVDISSTQLRNAANP